MSQSGGAQFTPGPWVINANGDITSPHGAICWLPSGIAYKQANAHLIAAAPDLLVALEDLLEMAEDQARFIEAEVLEGVRGSLFNQDDVLDAKEKLDRAKAVIAKAENHSNEK